MFFRRLHPSVILTAPFGVYISYSLWTVYKIYYPNVGISLLNSIKPSWERPSFKVPAFASSSKSAYADQELSETMANIPQKTPVSLLQELCALHTLTADYKLMSVEGVVHAPTFMYRVQVGEVAATATGASKKKAKHAVAKALLKKLLTVEGGFPDGFDSDGVIITSETLDEFDTESAPAPPQCTEENLRGNPVSRVQELCQFQKLEPPLYEVEDESGLPHERTFRIACMVKEYREIGEDKNKKLAKRDAADKMLHKLLKLGYVENEKKPKSTEDQYVISSENDPANTQEKEAAVSNIEEIESKLSEL